MLHAEAGGERVDAFLARAVPDLSRAHAQRLIAEGMVRVNGGAAKPSLRLAAGDQVEVEMPAPVPIDLAPESIPLRVVFEDADVIVIDKPAGLTVHPAPGHPNGTLVNALLAHCTDLAGIEGSLRPGIVHRLDKDTSGLLMVAKNDRAQLALSDQIAHRQVLKAYLVMVAGHPRKAGVIDAPIGRHPAQRRRMAIVAEGRPARTHYRVVAEVGENALAVAVLETGRTHQVRVHFAGIGHPVLGDAVYGRRWDGLERQFLHAWRLAFAHPRTGAHIELEAPLPPDLHGALSAAVRAGGQAHVDAAIEAMLQSARAGGRRRMPWQKPSSPSTRPRSSVSPRGKDAALVGSLLALLLSPASHPPMRNVR
jgi:23S rRNA pseudouridine1911/1915/1917 synthase